MLIFLSLFAVDEPIDRKESVQSDWKNNLKENQKAKEREKRVGNRGSRE
jgi:hypothetical protein